MAVLSITVETVREALTHLYVRSYTKDKGVAVLQVHTSGQASISVLNFLCMLKMLFFWDQLRNVEQ